jgi:hypothetical protein
MRSHEPILAGSGLTDRRRRWFLVVALPTPLRAGMRAHSSAAVRPVRGARRTCGSAVDGLPLTPHGDGKTHVLETSRTVGSGQRPPPCRCQRPGRLVKPRLASGDEVARRFGRAAVTRVGPLSTGRSPRTVPNSSGESDQVAAGAPAPARRLDRRSAMVTSTASLQARVSHALRGVSSSCGSSGVDPRPCRRPNPARSDCR